MKSASDPSVWGPALLSHLTAELSQLNELWELTQQLNQRLNQAGSRFDDQAFQDLSHVQARQAHIQNARSEWTQRLADWTGEAGNLTQALKLLEPEYREKIRQIRAEIYDKILQIQSTTYANQIVLGYHANFYEQFLMALAGSPELAGDIRNGDNAWKSPGQWVQQDC